MDGFIPYLVLIRFDKDEGLLQRLRAAGPRLRSTLAAIGKHELVATSYDGSMVAYLVEARADTQPRALMGFLMSGPEDVGSALNAADKVLVLCCDVGTASRLERVTDVLREWDLLAYR
jgi:hypothetical protein